MIDNKIQTTGNEIAIIGISGRFPQANSIDELWKKIRNGEECIIHYKEEELRAEGISEYLLQQKNYIKSKGDISDIDMFDSSFFNINPKEAELMDPQHRMLLECAWSTLEHAGYNPLQYPGDIGVYAGKSMSTYLFLNLYPHIKHVLAAGNLQAAIGNDKDSITTTISYHLDLRGPSITTQSSSSTSLVSVCMAAQSLLTYQCDMALAGGITAGPPQKSGYLYDIGGIMSADGHNKSFDKASTGFVPGSGYGLVLLKRLEDAIEDHDHIWAIISGYSVNNDGINKVSYTAPSVKSQVHLVNEAQIMAKITPDEISYVEMHGTGTRLGDPIEMRGLTQAFNLSTKKKQYCPVGSIKSNIGHLDSAAGIAGLIKTVLSLYYKEIVPSINCQEENPEMDIENTPFYINKTLQHWAGIDGKRYAGVTSLGMGGTNAHIILRDSNIRVETNITKNKKLMLISAKTEYSLKHNLNNIKKYLEENKQEKNEDICYTLSVGREHFAYRKAFVFTNRTDLLEQFNSISISQTPLCSCKRSLIIVLPSADKSYLKQGTELYFVDKQFCNYYNKCATLFSEHIPKFPDVRNIFKMKDKEIESLYSNDSIIRIHTFSFQYALVSSLVIRGIKPTTIIGHKIGFWVGSVISGLMTLEQAVNLIISAETNMFSDFYDKINTSVNDVALEYQKDISLISTIQSGTTNEKLYNSYKAEMQENNQIDLINEYVVTNNYNLFLFCEGNESKDDFPSVLRHIITNTQPEKDLYISTIDITDVAYIAKKVWQLGVPIDWMNYYSLEKRKRVPLPTYAFDRKSYWIQPLDPVQTEIKTNKRVEYNRPDLPKQYIKPETDIEKSIVKIWEELLGVHPIGIEDNFFDLNGHSLLGTQIMSRITQLYLIEIPLDILFEKATVKELAQEVEEKLKETKITNSLFEQLTNEIQDFDSTKVNYIS